MLQLELPSDMITIAIFAILDDHGFPPHLVVKFLKRVLDSFRDLIIVSVGLEQLVRTGR